MHQAPKHIIFDLDGTLVDSALVIAGVLNEMRAQRELATLDANSVSKWVSLGAETLIAKGLQIDKADKVSIAAALADFRSRYASAPTPLGSVYPGVSALLNALSDIGTRLSLCTNKPRPLAEKVLAETGLRAYFPFICAGGDLPNPKPHPSNILACMSYHACSAADTWLVGDSSIDQQCANNAGVGFVFHARGYNDGVHAQHCLISFEDYLNFKSLVLPF